MSKLQQHSNQVTFLSNMELLAKLTHTHTQNIMRPKIMFYDSLFCKDYNLKIKCQIHQEDSNMPTFILEHNTIYS